MRSRILAVYNNEFILGKACVGSENCRDHKIIEICYIFNINRIPFKIVRRRTGMAHQQRVSRSESRVIERAVGKSCQRPPLVFMLEENILSTRSNKNDVM